MRQAASSAKASRCASSRCREVFERQPESYRAHVLPAGAARLVIEAGVADGWWRLVGGRGDVLGMTTFGESAPAEALFEHFGFTVDAVAAAGRRLPRNTLSPEPAPRRGARASECGSVFFAWYPSSRRQHAR